MLQVIFPLKARVFFKSFLFQVDTLEKILCMASREYMWKDVPCNVAYNGQTYQQAKGSGTETREINSGIGHQIFSSGQFSLSVVSSSLWPHGLQHARLPCPSPTPEADSKLISIESVMPSNHLILCRPLLLRLQSFPASGSFPVSQFFASGGHSIGASASASGLPMNIQSWFPLGWLRNNKIIIIL